MNKNNHLIEYLSLTLILSYFIIHNIILVITGIIFSLYLINLNFIYSFIRTINRKLGREYVNKELNKNNSEMQANTIPKKLNKEDQKLTLVQTIEELGFIPSIDKNEDGNAA
tara:strand:- start:150 stop:485 length:336 start_codon:yes stop_codon:yes gene_type:complete